MNSASAGKTYIKMQSQLLSDDDCACFLVEAIAQRSQNINGKQQLMVKRFLIKDTASEFGSILCTGYW